MKVLLIGTDHSTAEVAAGTQRGLMHFFPRVPAATSAVECPKVCCSYLVCRRALIRLFRCKNNRRRSILPFKLHDAAVTGIGQRDCELFDRGSSLADFHIHSPEVLL